MSLSFLGVIVVITIGAIIRSYIDRNKPRGE